MVAGVAEEFVQPGAFVHQPGAGAALVAGQRGERGLHGGGIVQALHAHEGGFLALDVAQIEGAPGFGGLPA